MREFEVSVSGRIRRIVLSNEEVRGKTPESSEVQTLIPNPEGSLVLAVAFPEFVGAKSVSDVREKEELIVSEILRYANHYLLCHREAYGDPNVHAVSRIALGTFVVRIDEERDSVNIVHSVQSKFAAEKALAEVFLWGEQGLTDVFIMLLDGETEASPEWLAFLDSEQALQEGRFREAVLASVTLLELLVSPRLARFLKEHGLIEHSVSSFLHDLSLRARFDFFASAMHPDILRIDQADMSLLDSIRGSIKLRNSIVHEGTRCEEADARRAVSTIGEVARRVVIEERYGDQEGFDLKGAIKDESFWDKHWSSVAEKYRK